MEKRIDQGDTMSDDDDDLIEHTTFAVEIEVECFLELKKTPTCLSSAKVFSKLERAYVFSLEKKTIRESIEVQQSRQEKEADETIEP